MDLIIDFGASNIKYAVFSMNSLVESGTINSGSSTYLVSKGLTKKTSCFNIKDSLNLLLTRLMHLDLERLFVCSEMHGVKFADDYYSWMSLTQPVLIDPSEFLAKTGMKSWSGLPAFTLELFMRNEMFINDTYVGDFKDCFLDISNNTSNITVFSSLGLIDIRTKEVLHEFRDKFKLPKVTSKLDEVLGYVKISNHLAPVYFGIGDLQAALYGVGYIIDYPIVINLGTGSQIALPPTFLGNTEVEERIYVDGSIFPVITHIPSGRLLTTIAKLLNENEFWEIWTSLTASEVLNANKNTFKIDGFGFNKSNILGTMSIMENCSKREYILDLAHWYCIQYVEQLNKFHFVEEEKKIALTGGISSRSRFILEVFSYYLPDFTIEFVSSEYPDVTIDGMIKLVNEVMG
jgi:hypothetical protein